MKSPAQPAAVLVVDHGQATSALCSSLHAPDYAAACASTGREAADLMRRNSYDAAIIDADSRALAISLLKQIKGQSPEITVVVLSASATLDAASEYMRHGAHDVIGKPFDPAYLNSVLQRLLERKGLIEKLNRLKRRNWLLALSIPIWIILGYLLVRFI